MMAVGMFGHGQPTVGGRVQILPGATRRQDAVLVRFIGGTLK